MLPAPAPLGRAGRPSGRSRRYRRAGAGSCAPSSSGSPGRIVHSINVVAPGTIDITLDWDDPAAKLTLFLTDPTNTQVAAVTTTAKPKTISYPATLSGAYKIGVKAATGAANYT